jgi:hypothetical protein
MQSKWALNGGDDMIFITTERGTNKGDVAYLARHAVAVDEALDEVVTDEGDRGDLIDAMDVELADDVVSLGSDAVLYEITIPE